MRLRTILRISKWEVTKNAGGLDRRTVFIALGAMALVGIISPLVAAGGVGLDDGLYRVGGVEGSPYYEVAEEDDTFVVVEGADRGDVGEDIELYLGPTGVRHAQSPKGLAAREELRSSVENYNDAQMREEPNQVAAFPVDVLLEYETQQNVTESVQLDQDQDTQTTPADGGTGTDTGDGTGGDSDGTDDGTTDTDGGGAISDEERRSGGGGDGSVGGLGSTLSGDSSMSGSPSDISPPFPFESLVLAFLFVIPLNFLIQAYGSTILSERLNRRGELMLVAPVSRLEIISGKTFPYFLGALAAESVIAVSLTYVSTGTIGGIISILAVTPLILLFLSATFLGAMFARSFKELTFVTVTITVSLTSFAFVPAIFTNVGPIALISPLTLVVRDLQNEAITLGQFVYSTVPATLTALVLFGLGTGLYREEDMFTQRSIPLKILDSLAGPITRRWHVGLMSAVLLPFVLVAELMAVALLFALGEISIPLILVVVAVIEELGKSLHIYASYVHDRFDRRLRTALGLGLASGVGFFFAEKLSLIAQLVGLPDLEIGEAALQTGVGASGPTILLFLLAPLALHVVTASISATGARKSREAYVLSLIAAILLHLLYNLWVVTTYV